MEAGSDRLRKVNIEQESGVLTSMMIVCSLPAGLAAHHVKLYVSVLPTKSRNGVTGSNEKTKKQKREKRGGKSVPVIYVERKRSQNSVFYWPRIEAIGNK